MGVVKYVWYETTLLFDKKKENERRESIFQARLASIDETSLHITPIRASYIVQYKGGLIGRQFKDLAQIMSFTLYDIAPDDLIECWVRLGWFISLLWYPRIEEIEIYLVCI